MDDDRGGGVREFDRFARVRASGNGSSEICHDSVAGAHNIYLTAYGKCWHVRGLSVWGNANDSAFGECNKDLSVIALGDVAGGVSYFFEIRRDGGPAEGSQLSGVHFEYDGRKASEPMPAVGHNDLLGLFFRNLPDCL